MGIIILIMRELPNIISKMFKINLRKENTYITGLSMEDYGALNRLFQNRIIIRLLLSGVLDIEL